MAPDGGVHPVKPRMTGAHHGVFQPEEVLARDERDVHLDSPVQGGDPQEEPLLGLRKALVLVLFHRIRGLLSLPIFCPLRYT